MRRARSTAPTPPNVWRCRRDRDAGRACPLPALLPGGGFVTAADTVRANGWTIGTRLVGDESYGPTTIEITAIGRDQVLAVAVSGVGAEPRIESTWVFHCRDWQVTQ